MMLRRQRVSSPVAVTPPAALPSSPPEYDDDYQDEPQPGQTNSCACWGPPRIGSSRIVVAHACLSAFA